MDVRIYVFGIIVVFLFMYSNKYYCCYRGVVGVEESVGLSYDYYKKECPEIEEIIRRGVETISFSDPTTPSALLRLMFHDCQVQGCDASILLDLLDATTPSSEMASPRNYAIRKRETISLLKSMVDTVCPHLVSCADILILAARDAVSISGGPHVEVLLGRKDSSTPASHELATSLLPPPNIGVDGTLDIFAMKGMSVEDSVAILGAHTLGVTHCLNIPSHDLQGFDTMLSMSCPFGALTENTSFVVNDPTTLIFDNQYYHNIIDGLGILRVDGELALDKRTAPFVQLFAADQDHFFRAFSSAFMKLSSFGVLTGDRGVIRRDCSVVS